MSDNAPAPPVAGSDGADHDEEHQSRGTMVVTLVFLAGTLAVWLWTFSMLIERG